MKKILLSLIAISFLKLNAQWAPQTAPAGTGNLYSVFAISPTAIAASGNARVIRSLNAGGTWTSPLSVTGVDFFEVHTANPAKWYALSSNSTWFIKLSNPGGTSLQGGKPDSILSLHFPNPACAIAVGIAGKIEASCDTGVTWSPRISGTTSNLFAIWFADKDTGCAVGAGGVIRRTTDAGTTWSAVTSGVSTSLNGIHFPSATVGYAVGNGGTVIKTTDAGKTWTTVPTGTLNTLNGVFFTHVDTGYVVGTAGLILKTVNGGASWSTMVSGTTAVLNSVHFAAPEEGWVVGNGGTILKYNPLATGVSLYDKSKSVSIYPNPARNNITVKSSNEISGLKLYNAIGQLALQTKPNFQTAELNLELFPAGVYFLEISQAEETILKKIVKE